MSVHLTRGAVALVLNEPLPPGSGPTQKFDGPWLSTQLTISLSIGVSSFLLFCFLRTRWNLVYMGRTKLKDFSPTAAHSPDALNGSSFFGWIIPTLRTSEFTVLQTVGLDAAVLLNFYRMAFLLFSLLAILATVILMPLNFFRHGSTDIDIPSPDNSTHGNSTDIMVLFQTTLPANTTKPPTLYDALLNPETSAIVNLLFTYVFTGLVLTFLHRNFHRFIQSRQTFSLHLIHSISARTVLVTNLPPHLRGDKVLADYFESCDWAVESVSVCREVEPLRKVLEQRTNALLELEKAWTAWVGNPAKGVTGYDPEVYAGTRQKKNGRILTESPEPSSEPLVPDLDDPSTRGDQSETTEANGNDNGVVHRDAEHGQDDHCHVHTTRPRPTVRPRWFGSKVDAIEYWERKFIRADAEVRQSRRKGKFEATQNAFVTFEHIKDAQIACQVVHYPHHSEVVTQLAPEPRDVIWSNIAMGLRETQIRNVIVMGIMAVSLLFWIAPVSFLATLLSYKEIKRIAPWLAELIDKSPKLRAIVQNSLPSFGIILFNSVLPFFLSWLSFEQGYKSRSTTEYSLLKKYHIFLLVSVLFIFLLTSTFWALVRDLANSPARIPEKLATALLGSNARNFMISYVVLQALGLMPLQLLNLGPLFTLAWARATWCRTPRDYAEANAPPMLNYGWVYPQALLVFTITLVFSVVSPLILIFGALYFGAAYLVFKYKLLFIYFKPYESNGEGWGITFRRLLWALGLFQLFMTGIFSLRAPYWPSIAMLPLIGYTAWWAFTTHRDFSPLSEYIALSSISEVDRGGEAERVVGVTEEGPVPRSQSKLSNRRYAVNDETMYVAPSDKRTDYSQPPMSSFYYGVLNTGRRRYASPELSGLLPVPWLPAIAKPKAFGDGAAERRGVVLSLRRKVAQKLRRRQEETISGGGGEEEDERLRDQDTGRSQSVGLPDGWATWATEAESAPPTVGDQRQGSNDVNGNGSYGSRSGGTLLSAAPSNPWDDLAPEPQRERQVGKKLSFDPGSGVIVLPEDNVWGDDGSDSGEDDSPGAPTPESPSTYFHHPERRRTISANETVFSGSGIPSSSQDQII